MTAAERYIQQVVDRVPGDARLREQIAMEVRGHIAERVEHGESEADAIGRLGDPASLAESYLSAIPLESASFLARAAARIIDLVIFLAAVIPIGLPIGLLVRSGFAETAESIVPRILLVVFFLLVAPGYCLYMAIAEHTFSQTVGKHLLGLRVVRESGGRIGFGQAIVRQLPVFLEVFWIDALFALFTDKSQRAFEMVSKTRVVRTGDRSAQSSLPRLQNGAVAI